MRRSCKSPLHIIDPSSPGLANFIGRPFHHGALAVFIAAVLACSGCDSGPMIVPVSGKVTYEGEIVPEGTVTFYPVGGGRPAVGEIQPDGTYKLSYLRPGDGAVLGDFRITIEAKRVLNSADEPKSIEEELAGTGSLTDRPVQVQWFVPDEYAARSSSPLEATVEEGTNVIDFKLP